jgi:lysozyme family protein
MDIYHIVYKRTMQHEGGYANDPDDYGLETYRGISRRFHPNNPIWEYIDNYKKEHGEIPHNTYFPELEDQIEEFYKKTYWDKLGIDKILKMANSEQSIVWLARHLFDYGVNAGTARAATDLQRALNVLNNNGTLWKDISVDGGIGPVTLKTLKKVMKYSQRMKLLESSLLILRGYHYIKIMESRTSQEKYAYTWLNRLNIFTGHCVSTKPVAQAPSK